MTATNPTPCPRCQVCGPGGEALDELTDPSILRGRFVDCALCGGAGAVSSLLAAAYWLLDDAETPPRLSPERYERLVRQTVRLRRTVR